jgi:hypothetical protein
MGIARKYSEVVCKAVSRYWLTQEMEATYYRVTPEVRDALAEAGLMEDLGDGPEVDWDKLKDMSFDDSQNSLLQLEVEVESDRNSQVVTLGDAVWDF